MIGRAGTIGVVILAACAWLHGARAVSPGKSVHKITHQDLGAGENALLLHDLNSDGKLDLVAAQQSRDRIAVRLGDGVGGFGVSRYYAAGRQPNWLDAADINSDGRADLIIANHECQCLTLLLGDGSGGFEAAENSPLRVAVSPHVHMVEAEDLDNDGTLDLVVDSRDEHGVLVLKGAGHGKFETPGTAIDVRGTPYLGFALADLNGDGRLDLVTPNRNNISVLLGVRSSSFTFKPVQFLSFAEPFAVRIADFNNDGHPDLVAASQQGGAGIRLYLGDGSGHFNDVPDATFKLSAGGKDIAIGDVDGDGFRDAVVTSWNSDVRIIYGGRRGFKSSGLKLEGLKSPWGVASGDLNGDGRDDILIADGVASRGNLYVSGK